MEQSKFMAPYKAVLFRVQERHFYLGRPVVFERLRSRPALPEFIVGRSMLPFHSSLCLGGMSCLAVPFRGTGGKAGEKECLTSLVCFLLWRDATNRSACSFPYNH